MERDISGDTVWPDYLWQPCNLRLTGIHAGFNTFTNYVLSSTISSVINASSTKICGFKVKLVTYTSVNYVSC